MNILVSIITGGIAGWLAGIIMRSNHNVLINVLLGLAGGAVGGFILRLLGIYAYGFLGNILVAIIGACLLIFIAKRFQEEKLFKV